MVHSWAEINLDNIRHNVKQLCKCLSSDTAFMAVVKADAYGHGAYKVAQAALGAGAKWLGVATAGEGARLRADGINTAPILVLGGIMPCEAAEVLSNDLCQTVFSNEVLKALSDEAVLQGKKARVHIKVDTGMNRVGVRPGQELQQLITFAQGLPNIEITGMFTHFALSDAADKTFTKYQLSLFNEAARQAKALGVEHLMLHAANSAAIIDCPEAHFDIVRGGIAMYGYYPSDEIIHADSVELKPALSWKSRVIYVKEVPVGEPVSYGCTYITERPTKVATISAGYADGYRRKLSNNGWVLIRGRRANIIGRICMDQFMVDVTDISGVGVGDEAVLIGEQGDQAVTAEDLARLCDTISYEIITSIGPRVPRIYIGG